MLERLGCLIVNRKVMMAETGRYSGGESERTDRLGVGEWESHGSTSFLLKNKTKNQVNVVALTESGWGEKERGEREEQEDRPERRCDDSGRDTQWATEYSEERSGRRYLFGHHQLLQHRGN